MALPSSLFWVSRGDSPSGNIDQEMRIALLGLPGAGKSTIAKLLSERLAIPSWDLDEEISVLSGLSPARWITEHSLDRFRAVEALMLGELCRVSEGIIALGGGTLEAPGAIQNLERWTAILLDAPDEVLADRISGSKRPPLTDLEPLAELATIRSRRAPLFEALSPLATISSAGEIQETLQGILEALTDRVGEGPW